MKTISIVMFDDFETLDAFGPAEVLSKLDGYEIRSVSLLGGIVTNSQGIMVVTERMLDVQDSDILIVPGGMGTRTLVTDDWFLSGLSDLASKAKWVLSVCTGSALLAAAGILDGRHATTNKNAFDWVRNQGTSVLWEREPRWVRDGNIYTAASVSAGTDMAVGFVADQFGKEKAEEICKQIEYHWYDNAAHDTF